MTDRTSSSDFGGLARVGPDQPAVERLSAQECLALLARLGWTTTQVASRLVQLQAGPALTPGRVLTVRQVAERLGRSEHYVRDLLRGGELPGIKRPGRKYWGVSEAALVAWQQSPVDTRGPEGRYSDPEPQTFVVRRGRPRCPRPGGVPFPPGGAPA